MSHGVPEEPEVMEEISFGDFASLQNSMSRQELLEGDFSVLDGGSATINNDGSMSAPFFPPDSMDVSKRFMQLQEKFTESQEAVRQLRHRLIRRTSVIDGIRKYYLRDVVTMKHIIKEMLTDEERRDAWRQYEYILPSLDFKEALDVHAPERCAFKVTPCETCGGKLELTMKGNDEAEHLKKTLKDSKEREGRWRVKLADLDAELERVGKEKAEATKSHLEEKRVLFGELKKLRDEIEALRTEMSALRHHNKRFKDENETLGKENHELRLSANRLVQLEKEQEIAKSNQEELMESNKNLKNAEKGLQKDLANARADIKDLTSTNEKLENNIKYLQQEAKQLNSSIERLHATHEEVEQNLGVSNHANLELTNRLLEHEDHLRQANEENSQLVEAYEASLDKLRAELKGVNKKLVESTAEGRRAKKLADDQTYVVEDLQKLTSHLKLDIKDLEDEIQIIEQERRSMQTLIKNKLASQPHSDVVHLMDKFSAMASAADVSMSGSIALPVPAGPSDAALSKQEEEVAQLLQRRTEIRKQRALRQSQILDGSALAQMMADLNAARAEVAPLEAEPRHGDEPTAKDGRSASKLKAKASRDKPKTAKKAKARKPKRRGSGENESAGEEDADDDDELEIEQRSDEEADAVDDEDDDGRPRRRSRSTSLSDDEGDDSKPSKKSRAVAPKAKKPKTQRSALSAATGEGKTRKSVAAAPRAKGANRNPSKASRSVTAKVGPKASVSQRKGGKGSKRAAAQDDELDVERAVGQAVAALQGSHDESDEDEQDPGEDSQEEFLDPDNESMGSLDNDSLSLALDLEEQFKEEDEEDEQADELAEAEAEVPLDPTLSDEAKAEIEAARAARAAERKARKEAKEHRLRERKALLEQQEKERRERHERKAREREERKTRKAEERLAKQQENAERRRLHEEKLKARREAEELARQLEELDREEEAAEEEEAEEPLEPLEELPDEPEPESEPEPEPEPEPIAIPADTDDPEAAVRAAEEAAAVAAQRRAERDARKAARQRELEVKKAEREAKRAELEMKKAEREAQRQIRSAERARILAQHEAKEREEKRVQLVRAEAIIKPKPAVRVVEISDDEGDDVELAEAEAERDVELDEPAEPDGEARIVSGYDHVRKASTSGRPDSSKTIIVRKKKERAPKSSKRSAPPSAERRQRTSLRQEREEESAAEQADAADATDAAEVTETAAPRGPLAKRALVITKAPRPTSATHAPVAGFLETLFRARLQTLCEEAAPQLNVSVEDLVHMHDDFLQDVCTTFGKSLQTMWETLQSSRESLDMAQKLLLVLQVALACGEDSSAEVLHKASKKAAGLVTSSASPAATAQWVQAALVDADVLAELSLAPDAAGPRSFADAFSLDTVKSDALLAVKLDAYYANAYKMSATLHELQGAVGEQMETLLIDWGAARAGVVAVTAQLEEETAALKKASDLKIVGLGKELTKSNSLLDKTLEKLKVAETRIKDYMKMEMAMKDLEVSHRSLTREYEIATEKLTDMTVDYNVMKEEYRQFAGRLARLQEGADMAEAEAEVWRLSLQQMQLDKVGLEDDLAEQLQAFEALHVQYSRMVEKEYARLNLLCSTAMQCDPLLTDSSVQTEFLVPPMDLKTVVMDKLSRSSVRSYPQVYSQSLDALPSLSSTATGSDHASGYAYSHSISNVSSPPLLGHLHGRESREAAHGHQRPLSRPSTFNQHINSLLGASDSDLANHTAQLLNPHSPPMGKYSQRINEDDLMSFLSLRLPTTNSNASVGGGEGADAYSPRSVNSSSTNASHGGKGRLAKTRWAASNAPMRPSSRDRELQIVVGNARGLPTGKLSESADRPGSPDFMDLSGPPSPVTVRNAKHIGETKVAFPDMKQIVYKPKGVSRFRTVDGEHAEPAAPVTALDSLVVSASKGPQAARSKATAAQRIRPVVVEDREQRFPAIAANSDTLRKMRKELLSR